MDAAKFIKEYIRMCNSFEITNCKGCAALDELKCCDLNTENPEKLVEIVEQWSQEHPQKTMMDDFFEKFPNALKDSFGNPMVCPQALGYGDFCCDDTEHNCTVCWSHPLEES